MNTPLARASFYLETGRVDDAERELRLHLAEDPNNARALGILALVLLQREELVEAQSTAEQAVHNAPDVPFVHRALARVLLVREDAKGARKAVDEAIALDPADGDGWVLLARIHATKERWDEALLAVDRALAIEPEEPDALALRSVALAHLGRSDEARDAADQALRAGPDDDDAHTAAGFAALHANDPRRAREHFVEALRLDPTNEAARAGLVQAIKGTNPVYRVILAFFLWMARIGGRWRWALIIGFFVLNRVLRSAAKANPVLEPVAGPVTVVYIAFVVITWLAEPVSNLFLRLHPMGKHALSRDQRRQSNWVGGLALLALACTAGLIVTGDSDFGFAIALCCFGVLLPVGTYHCDPGWPRTLSAIYSFVVGFVAILGCTLMLLADEGTVDNVGAALGVLALIGMIAASWGMSILGAITPKK